MVKPYNYDFKKYKKETDYQAEINKALSEGDYYGAAVNEQFRNAKIELEGLEDKYQPTFKYMYCINPDGTKNQEEIAKFEAQNSKPQEPKVANTANVTDIAKVTATPNSANGKTLKTASQILETGDKADQTKLETSVKDSAKDNATNNVAKNTTNSTSNTIENVADVKDTPTITNQQTTEQNVTTAATGKNNSEYTLPTEIQAGSTTYWLNRSTGTYNFRDTHLMISALDKFLDTLNKEYEAKEYYGANSFDHIFNTRTKQIDTAINMIDWYEDYIKNNHDEVNEIYGGEEIDTFIAKFSEVREGLKKQKTTLSIDKMVRSLYSNEGEWLAFNNYDKAVSLLGEGVAEIQRLMDLLSDPKYLHANASLSDEDAALVKERESIIRQIEAWDKRLEPLEKALVEVNTLNFQKDLQQQINTGLTYELLEKQLKNVEKLINTYQVAYNNTHGPNNKNRKAHFEHMVSVYTEQKKVIQARMRIMKDLNYAQYRKASDWKVLSLPKRPVCQTEAQIKGFLKNNVNNPYYYINNTFGMREYYKTQSRSGSDFNANGSLPNARRYGSLMYTEKRPTGEFEVYDYMSQEEIKTYNYIYHKFGENKANEYLKSITDQMKYSISVEGKVIENPDGLNYRWGVIDASDDNFLEKMANSVGVGLKRFGINIAQLFSKDPIAVTKDEYRYEITVGQASKIEGVFLKTLNNVSEEMPSTLLELAIGSYSTLAGKTVGLVSSVISKAGNAYRTSLNAGYTNTQAFNYATLIGASELCFSIIGEKVDSIVTSKSSLASEKLIKSAGEKISVLDDVLQKVSMELKSSVIAGTEETLKSLMEPIFKELLFDEAMSKEDFAQTAEKYLIGTLTELVQ